MFQNIKYKVKQGDFTISITDPASFKLKMASDRNKMIGAIAFAIVLAGGIAFMGAVLAGMITNTNHMSFATKKGLMSAASMLAVISLSFGVYAGAKGSEWKSQRDAFYIWDAQQPKPCNMG